MANLERRAEAMERAERAVSHMRIGPPLWARIPADDAAGIKTHCTPARIPDVLAFEENEVPRCRCGWAPDAAPHRSAIRQIDCVVYDILGAEPRKIEVVDCAVCPARYQQAAGPDLGTLGLFNHNNERIVTHRLLNNYSATFTKVASPFDAYVEVRARDYMEAQSAHLFMSADVFRTVWFSFVRLQHHDHAFECYICGRNPKVVVADGISAGFDVRHMRQCIRPPTTVDASSPVVADVVRHDPTTLIRDRKIRREAIAAVRWRKALRASQVEALRAKKVDAGTATAYDDDDSTLR